MAAVSTPRMSFARTSSSSSRGSSEQLGERRIRQPVDVLELLRGALAGRLVADPEEGLAPSRGRGRWVGVAAYPEAHSTSAGTPCGTVNEP